MSEADKNVEGQERKVCSLAVWSVGLVILGFFMLPFLGAVAIPASPSIIFGRNVLCLPFLLGLILGVDALSKIKKAGGLLKGRTLAIIGVVFNILFLGIWLSDQLTTDLSRGSSPSCGNSMSSLGKGFLIYESENKEKYPPADKWCDVLMEFDEIDEGKFICPSLVLYWPIVGHKVKPMLALPLPKKGRSHYAMNPKCKPNSGGDVVLLFETKGRWNQFGGAELLTGENHKGRGANILFNDGSVRFVQVERFEELNWGNKKNIESR